MVDIVGREFRLRRSGTWTPRFPQVAIRHIKWYLARILLTRIDGGTMMSNQLLAQDTWLGGQFADQRKLRMQAQEGAVKKNGCPFRGCSFVL